VVLIADVASPWNDGIDFQQVREVGIEAVAIKASEGTAYRNPLYAQWVAEAQSAGLVPFPYHWLTEEEANPQWNNFAEAVGEPYPALAMLAVNTVDGECLTYHEYILRERIFERRLGQGGALMLTLPRNVWFANWDSPSLRVAAVYMLDARPVEKEGVDILTLRDSIPPAWLTQYGDRPLDGLQFTDTAEIGGVKDIGVSVAPSLTITKLRTLNATPNMTTPGDDVLSGELNKGDQAMTIICFPKGAYSHIAFGTMILDEGADGNSVHLRVRVHTDDVQWRDPERLAVIYRTKTVYKFPSQYVDMVAVQRLDMPDVTIGYDVA
jgi:Glycosyl hydrolases family 25